MAAVEEYHETDRLVFRRVLASDALAFHEMLSDPEAMKFWSTPPHKTFQKTQKWIQREISASPSVSNMFVICLKPPAAAAAENEAPPPRVIGKLGAWRVPEIGFIFHPSVWGQGIATEALVKYLEIFWNDAAFAHVRCLKADVDPRNMSCLKLLGKVGFVVTGSEVRTYETLEGWCDSVYLELERPEKMGM